MKDLTQGNEAKQIFFFALPMLIGNIFQQLYSTVDSIIVGRALGKSALAAVGASFPILFLLIALIMGITMGSTIMISQFYGARDIKKVKTTIDTAYISLLIGALIMMVVGLMISGPILKLLKTPDTVLPTAKSYLNIMFLGMPVMFGYNSISAILRGLGDSRTPLTFLIIATVINIILDLIFVMVFNWGVAGAAWATVIAQACSFAFGVFHLNRTHEVLRFSIKGMTYDKEIFKTIVRIGLPSGVQQMLVSAGMMALTRIVNGYGTDTMAAYTAATRIESFAVMPCMNVSMAVSTFVGQNIGANKPERVKQGFKAGILISGTISLTISIVVILFGKHLISIFTSDAAVKAIGGRYLTIVGAFFIVFSTQFIVNAVLRGAGDTFVPMLFTILSLWVIRIPASALLSARIGSDGIWWGIPVAWIAGLLMCYSYYRTDKWKNKAVVRRSVLNAE
ncbi:multidrug export protein MepA [Oxobacter pfennigii]|uniref:Probable multidrug resistance protein NorM n=1 Tax=Oxobacter pfennigii TaxID=36849 RepID=A0A0P8WBN2_9CLOT|nr:MATE family efflux transporter [Oxobacter pfennigii]KPU45129.1 multidrug export protein MepA [Oxobacter pfennigii]